MLMKIDDIRLGLDTQFEPLEPMLSGFRLNEGGESEESLSLLEGKLGINLSGTFRDLISKYNFGEFTLGAIAFGNTGDYSEWLLDINSPCKTLTVPWWSPGERPVDKLMIANSDPYAILLDCGFGNISAFRHDQPWQAGQESVAVDFGQFLRGIGTVFLNRGVGMDNLQLADKICTAVGAAEAQAFWRWLAE